ncbi:MAG: MTH938/NDUFAF3 family protein [Arenicellales bacterium]
MELETEKSEGRTIISSYESEGVLIGTETLSESFILVPGLKPRRWEVDWFSDLSASTLGDLCSVDCDVLIVGTGIEQQFPGPELARVLAERGRSAEFMSSRSACITFNILSLDDRSVAAAIILPL